MTSRPIKEGFRGVGRHWAMSISSAMAVTVTLLIVSLFLVFSYHLQKFTRNFESSMEIAVTISYDYESTADKDRIQKEIESIEGVKGVTYFTKEQELEFYLSRFEDERTKEAFKPFIGERNPMHDAFYVETDTGAQLSDVADKIRTIEGVDQVEYGGDSTLSVVSMMMSVRRFGLFFVVILGLLAIFLIQNTIKLTIYARIDEIKIMRDVGASNGFIRAPFVWEGVITGFMGAIIPIVVTIYAYISVYRATGGIIFADIFTLVKPIPFLYYLSAIIAGLGIVVGLIGSYLSVTRYLREKR